MPKHSRPGTVRVELNVPDDVMTAVDAKAGPGGRNAWIVAAIARAAGKKPPVLRGRGRPAKSETAAT